MASPTPATLAAGAALLALTLAAGDPVVAAPEEEAARRVLVAIDGHLRSSMARHRTPGVALALTTRDGLAAERVWGHADLKLRRELTPETLFQIGSISKSFTALLALGLADEKRLDLDAPVSRYLPWFEVHSEFEPIRVEHLLTHTAGIPANRDDIFSSQYMARALRHQAAAWEPGSRFHYSNVGYQVLHALLERVAGEGYQEMVEGRIFEPLGMRHSRSEITLDSRAEQAVGYLPPYDDRPRHPSRHLVEAPHLEYRIGDGCIQSTAADLAAWVRMWLNRGAGPRGRLVSEAAFERFATPHPGTLSEDGSHGYGLGVDVLREDGRWYLRHGGGMVGFYAFALADMTEGLGVAVLMNGPGGDRALAEHALAVWRASRAEEPPPGPPDPEAPLSGEVLAEYAGRFTDAAGSALDLRVDGNRLHLERGDESVALDWTTTDTFYSPDPELDRYTFSFGRDDEGNVVEVSHGAGWYANRRYAGPRAFDVPEAWSAYVGRYRSFSPWFPYFEIVVRKGRLLAITGEGGETTSGATVLLPAGEGVFRVGEEITPEWVRFEETVDGRALKAVWSGHPFFRQ